MPAMSERLELSRALLAAAAACSLTGTAALLTGVLAASDLALRVGDR
jgi:hypothetical protein